MRSRLAVGVVVFASASVAQGVVPPSSSQIVLPLPGVSSAIGGVTVWSAHFVHLPGSPPNVFYGAFTVGALPGSLGAAGGQDFVCGDYDVLTDTFTPTAEAAALNSPGHETQISLHHSGLLAAFSRGVGFPWLARRAAIGQPWQVVAQIAGVP